MKFDFVIGNPPYQEEAENKSETNGQARRKSIFQYFQMEADNIAKESSVLIYPGARWIHQSGKGMQQFGKELINDRRLALIEFYPNSKEVFGKNVDIPDGISIVAKKNEKESSGFEYIYNVNGNKNKVHLNNPGEELIPLNPNDGVIINKVTKFVDKMNLKYLNESVFPQKLFGIESDFIQKNSDVVKEYNNKTKLDEKTQIKVFTNDKAGASGRSKWFVIPRNMITQNVKYISEWQVVVSSAHPGGQDGRDNQLAIIDNKSVFGRARVALKSFSTEVEAKNFYKYVQSKIIRYTFLMTDEALTSLAKKVPDILDYSCENKIINFNEDIDAQLKKIINLTDDEFKYIKDSIDNK